MARVQLTPGDREFFSILSEAIVLNPFSDERALLLDRLAPGKAQAAWSLDPHDYALAADVDRRIEAVETLGGKSTGDFSASDAELMRWVFLYQAYHRLVPRLDALILAQLTQPESQPVDGGDVLALLSRRGFTEQESERYLAFAFQLRRAFHFIVASLIGESASIRRLQMQLWNCVFSFNLRTYVDVLIGRMEDFSTLLLGETGTGKGQAATAIGRSGYIPFDARRRRFTESFTDVFVAINLSQFPESLLESELFGHRKGAFTGAIDDHRGWFERCNAHGSLFLDEIGDIGVPTQIKLLQVLHDRTFTAVGSHKVLRFAGRIIGATNRPLEQLRASGTFRDDLFYRLSSDVITIPPLRERIEESPRELDLLVEALVARTTGCRNAELTGFVLDRLRADLPAGYAWPGNVRELEQLVRCVLLTGRCKGDPRAAAPAPGLEQQILDGALTAQELLSGYCALLYRRLGTYEAVAKRVGFDRRTVKGYVDRASRSTFPSC